MHPREIKINSIHPLFPRIPIWSRTHFPHLDFYLHPIAQLPWPTNTFSSLTLHSFRGTAVLTSFRKPFKFHRARVVNNYRIVRENVSIESFHGPCIEFTDRETSSVYIYSYIYTIYRKYFHADLFKRVCLINGGGGSKKV